MNMNNNKKNDLIKYFCLSNDLSTYDPYDIWKTKLGFFVKNGYNKSKYLFLLPAAVLTIFDLLFNNKTRFFYSKQDYAIVQALSVITLLNLKDQIALGVNNVLIENRLMWLTKNHCTGYNGVGWGINFKLSIDQKIVYKKNTPYSTITPYVLEAFIKYKEKTQNKKNDKYILGIYDFLEKDIKIIIENDDYIATSYGPLKDRIVTNSVSYTMYSYALLLDFMPKRKKYIKNKIMKLYNFICYNQQKDGSWFYNPYSENSFIDCFHSAFIIKNIIKTSKIIKLHDSDIVINAGFRYLENNFKDSKTGLYKRFSIQNKPGLTKFDLYDNAEMLNLYLLLNKNEDAKKLNKSISKTFIDGTDIYSIIDRFNFKRNKNTLRWAVFPYLYSLSQLQNEKA